MINNEERQMNEAEPIMNLQEAYIELCNKETEESISEKSSSFLNTGIDYFYHHKEEFMYLESPSFDKIGIDSICFEVDSVFKTYDMLLGIALKKKHEKSIKTFLTTNLNGESATFDLLFNNTEGIWELNFSVNDLPEFKENWTIEAAYLATYDFLLRLREYVEKNQ